MGNSKQTNGSGYHFDDVVIDRDDFRVRKRGQLKALTPRAFDVLVYLVEQRGRVVEKQELFEQIWKETFVTDNALMRAVKESAASWATMQVRPVASRPFKRLMRG